MNTLQMVLNMTFTLHDSLCQVSLPSACQPVSPPSGYKGGGVFQMVGKTTRCGAQKHHALSQSSFLTFGLLTSLKHQQKLPCFASIGTEIAAVICHDHLAYEIFLEASIPTVPPSPATAPETNDGTMRVKSVATLRVCKANSLVGDRMVAKVPFLWEMTNLGR